MERGRIDVGDLDGPFDLQSTVESGQSYLWNRADGQTYDELYLHGGDDWYETVVPPIDGVSEDRMAVRARQVGGVDDGRLEWEATADATELLTHLLRLDDDMDAIRDATPDLPLVERAFDAFPGMRLVRDPPFPCLVSFICSAQMRVERIHAMVQGLARHYGDPVTVGERTIHALPTAEQLARATEADLRERSLGYRAPYVLETARMVADGTDPRSVVDSSYESARETMTRYVGVGDKVADCVLLFSLGFDEAVPLDTWIQRAIREHYPDCDRGTYAETSRAIRETFGGERAGYAQTYVFHHLRTGGSVT